MVATRDDEARGPVVAMDAGTARRIMEESQDRPHEGRVYDYYLGGSANWAIDREFAKEQIRRFPDIPWISTQVRECLGRFVRYLLGQGIRQFVDLGSGLPTQGNVHQICEEVAPKEANVVYVDHDPVAAAHAFLLLEESDQLSRHGAVQGDVLEADRVWKACIDTGLINPTEPVGVILSSVLHFVPDAKRHAPVEFFRRHMLPGSYLALSHGTLDGMDETNRAVLAKVADNYKQTTAQMNLRTHDEVAEFFGGWPLVDPGLVWIVDWRPEGRRRTIGDLESSRCRGYAGVARKPERS